jgi:hypothetical protein
VTTASSSSGSGGGGGSAAVVLNPWDEQAGPIQQLPYRDWFRSDPIAGGRTELGAGAINTWGPEGSGWDGEHALIINPPPTDLEDTSGIAAQQLPPGVRRINAAYLARWNATAAAGVMDSKWFMLTRGNANGYIDASNPYPGLPDNGGSGQLRFNAQGMSYGGGLADFPAGIGELPTPMRGVTWPQMPFIEEASLSSFGNNEANADAWVCWEFEADLDTGYYLAFMTLEGGVTTLVTGYNIYAPPTATEGGTPLAEPAFTLADSSIVWFSTGGPGGFPYFEGLPVGSEFRISHFTVSNEYIGPPPGFAQNGSRPPVDGSAYQVGVFSGSPVLQPAP